MPPSCLGQYVGTVTPASQTGRCSENSMSNRSDYLRNSQQGPWFKSRTCKVNSAMAWHTGISSSTTSVSKSTKGKQAISRSQSNTFVGPGHRTVGA